MPRVTILELSHDLIVEILLWMPVTSLMQFRCVSKTWNSLVFDPDFVKLHLQRSSKNTYILLTSQEYVKTHRSNECHIRTSFATCSIPRFLENPSFTNFDSCLQFIGNNHVVGACNGLICFQKFSYPKYACVGYCVQFWNPATRVMSECSPSIEGSPRFWFGFGYDELNETYKVVAVFFNSNSRNWELRVHCMGETCWKSILTFPVFDTLKQDNGEFVNGTVNWLARTDDQLLILSCDLRHETCGFLAVPDDFHETSHIGPYLSVLQGCLCLTYSPTRTNLVICIMREFGVKESWTKLLNIRDLHQAQNCLPFPVNPLCMSENDDTVLLIYSKFFLLVDIKANRVIKCSRRTQDFNGGLRFFSNDYVQSLVKPCTN